MDRCSAACSCSDEDFIAIFSSIMWNDVPSHSLGYRRSARRLSEQDLLPFFCDGGAVRVRLASGIRTLRPGALARHVEPAPQVREVAQILLLTLPGNDPGIGSHVGDAVAVAGDELAVFEITIEHAIETVCLVDVAVDRVRDFDRSVEPEMVVLSGHRPQPAHLPEQPLSHSLAAPHIFRQEATGLLGQVPQDGT